MIDKSIMRDTELLDRAKQKQRDGVREYNREWRRRFKAENGISYTTYLVAKKLKDEQNK